MSLLLVGHVSDWYGRRTVLIPAQLIALVAALIFVTSYGKIPVTFNATAHASRTMYWLDGE